MINDNVVTLVGRLAKLCSGAEVTLKDFFATATIFEPIVASTAAVMTDLGSVVKVVIARTAEEFGKVVGVDEEVRATVTEDEEEAAAGLSPSSEKRKREVPSKRVSSITLGS